MKSSYPGAVIHCSASSFGNAQLIDGWHIEKGWSGVGYHLVILNGQIENNTFLDFMDGMIETARDWDKAGAHAKGYNNHIGICLIGVDRFTEKQFETLANILKALMRMFHFSLDDILFHYEVSSKTCPNFNKEWFIDKYMLGT